MHRMMDDSAPKQYPGSEQIGRSAPAQAAPAQSAPPDVLTDVLEELQLRSIVAGRTTLISPWTLRSAEGNGAFYAIIEGSCWLEADGLPQPLRLEPGDLLVLPHGRSHCLRDSLNRLASAPTNSRPVTAAPKPPPQSGQQSTAYATPPRPSTAAPTRPSLSTAAGPLSSQVGQTVTKLVSGCLIFHRCGASPLLGALPSVIHVRGQGTSTAWLTDTLRLIAREAAEHLPGSQTVINRLAYILFVQAVRAHVASLPPDARSWMRALRDPAIGRALGLMHAKPQLDWSVASLAEEVAMSRSVFAAQFCQMVGEPPLQYLTALRMRKARDLLRDRSVAIKEVAARVGYGSEASFGNAFKRWWGTAPGAYRRRAEDSAQPLKPPTSAPAPTDNNQPTPGSVEKSA
jgi:AraC-like DNA-binding protein